MIGLSGIEFKILELGSIQDGYAVTMDGPWWMKLLYDFGILQIYINRLLDNGMIDEVRVGWKYRTNIKGVRHIFDDYDNSTGNVSNF